MTNRIRAARRTTILPGVESLIVEEQSRARSTVAEAVKQLYDMKRIRPNDTIVAISGSPKLSLEEPRPFDCFSSTSKANCPIWNDALFYQRHRAFM